MSQQPVSTASSEARRVRAHSRWEGQYRNALSVRHFPQFHTAEPKKLGGDDSAPTPMEYVLAAYTGCLAVVIELVAKELDFSFDRLEIEAEGLIDRRGLFGVPGVSTHFQSVKATIHLQSPESPDLLPQLQAEVARRSPAHNLLVDAGIAVELTWELVRS